MRTLGWHLSLLLPLLSCLVLGFMSFFPSTKKKDAFSQWFSCICLVIGAWAALYGFFKFLQTPTPQWIPLYHLLRLSPEMSFDIGIQINWLSAMMFAVVNTISALVHIYSVGYMHNDKAIPRFMASLSLFTFMMLMLVSAPNFIQLFFGWEGVGLASYLLIGFWHHKESAALASMKAFVVNRVGDIGLLIGICLAYYGTQKLNIDFFLSDLPYVPQTLSFFGMNYSYTELAAFFFMIGAMGKSAQLFLHTWLPDAMEGPTPVSALIHAATMVTAGIFLIARLAPLFDMAETVRTIILIIGASTAFFAATVALSQNDIKRVIAYSTCSQLGYMFFALGCSAYGASVFHLFTHAFFKALLFLGAGSVIHAMSDEQNMQKMGGIYTLIPKTYGLMWLGTLALCGMPLLAGYYSKDAILFSAYLKETPLSTFVFYVGVGIAGMTALYSTRLMMLTFHGKPRANEHVMAHIHESPMVMLIPLIILGVGAVFAGSVFEKHFISAFNWADTHTIPVFIHYLPLMAALGGIGLGVWIYKKDSVSLSSDQWPKILKPLYYFSVNKWFFDELYEKTFVRFTKKSGQAFQWMDKHIIDFFGPDLTVRLTKRTAHAARLLQSGSLSMYIIFIGIILFVLLSLFVIQSVKG
jgi:NADH-quinone oxidoreductase subunit L